MMYGGIYDLPLVDLSCYETFSVMGELRGVPTTELHRYSVYTQPNIARKSVEEVEPASHTRAVPTRQVAGLV